MLHCHYGIETGTLEKWSRADSHAKFLFPFSESLNSQLGALCWCTYQTDDISRKSEETIDPCDNHKDMLRSPVLWWNRTEHLEALLALLHAVQMSGTCFLTRKLLPCISSLSRGGCRYDFHLNLRQAICSSSLLHSSINSFFSRINSFNVSSVVSRVFAALLLNETSSDRSAAITDSYTKHRSSIALFSLASLLSWDSSSKGAGGLVESRCGTLWLLGGAGFLDLLPTTTWRADELVDQCFTLEPSSSILGKFSKDGCALDWKGDRIIIGEDDIMVTVC